MVEAASPPPTLDSAIFSDWQALTWPGVSDPNIIGPDQDPDHDGLNNLLEWALHLNANGSDSFTPTFVRNGAFFEYTYTRRKTAPGEASFRVEWSDTLANDWSVQDVGEEIMVSETNTTETIRNMVPAGGGGQRFVRLKLEKP